MDKPNLTDQPTYGIAGACAYIRVSETSLRELVNSGELAAAKPSRELVFRREVLDAYLERLEREQTEARKVAYQEGLRASVPTAVSVVRGKRRLPPELPEFPKAA